MTDLAAPTISWSVMHLSGRTGEIWAIGDQEFHEIRDARRAALLLSAAGLTEANLVFASEADRAEFHETFGPIKVEVAPRGRHRRR